MIRVIGWIGIGLAVLFALALVVVGVVLFTDPGTRLAMGQVRVLLPAGVAIGRVEGRLGGRLVVHDLAFDQPGSRLGVARAVIDWSPAALLHGELEVAELAAHGVHYQATGDAGPDAAPTQLPDRVALPLPVRVARLEVTDVTLRTAPDADPLGVDTLTIADASFVDSRLELGRLALAAPLVSGHGRMALTAAGGYPLQARLQWQGRPAGMAAMNGTTSLDGSLRTLNFEQRLEPPYALAVSGSVTHLLDPATLTLDASFAVDAAHLAAIRSDLPDATVTLQGEVSGPPSGLEIRAEARGIDARKRQFIADLAAEVKGSTVDVQRLSIRQPGRDGRLLANGQVALGEDAVADLTVDWQSLTWPLTGDPEALSPRGSLTWSGSLDDYRLTLDARVAALGAEPADVTVDGRGSLKSVTVDVRAQSPAGSLQSRATVAWKPALDADVDWRLALNDLSAVVPAVHGRISGAGHVRGALPDLEVRAELQGSDLRYQEYALGKLDLDANVDLGGRTPSRVTLSAQRADVTGTALGRLELALSGTPEHHEMQTGIEAGDGSATLELSGRARNLWGPAPAWHYTLQTGRVAYAGVPDWNLEAPASGVVSAAGVQVAEQCWQAADARLCAQGRQNGQRLAARLRLHALPLDSLAALLPDDMSLHGRIDASAELSRSVDEPLTGQAEVTTSAGSFAWAPPSGAEGATELAFDESRLDVRLDPTRVQAQLDLETGPGRIHARAQTDAQLITGAGQTSLAERPLQARLAIEIPDLAFVSEFVPAVQQVGGAVAGELALDGSFGAPRASGTVTLSDGTLQVPGVGLDITGLAASLEGRADGLEVSAEATSGGGQARLAGHLAALGGPPRARLQVTGNAFQVVNNDEARLFASPQLDIEADAERVQVAGEVRVPRAEITPGKRSPSAVTVSEDQVLLGGASETEAGGRPLFADVTLILGDDVQFEGFGLKSGLTGKVAVKQEPETPVTANGEIELIDGEYRAYGQGLVIENGRIYFAGGPITQPALDIRAVRRPQEGILVGAHVQGTLQEPTFELFSEPTMPQQEQLSYLVLGRSPDQAPDGQSSALNRAALAMGLKGGDFLAKNLGARIGVDEIGIQSGSGEAGAPSDPNEAALVLGKYLSPRLYVSYGIGLFDPESVLRLQYEIARRWTVVTESSGASTGADVLYSVELGGAEDNDDSNDDTSDSRGAGAP